MSDFLDKRIFLWAAFLIFFGLVVFDVGYAGTPETCLVLGYDRYMEITPNRTTILPLQINGTAGFFGQEIITLPRATAICYMNADHTDYAVINSTGQEAHEDGTNGGGYLFNYIYETAENITFHFGSGNTNSTFAPNSKLTGNGTTGYAWAVNSSGKYGQGLRFNNDTDRQMISNNVVHQGISANFTWNIWYQSWEVGNKNDFVISQNGAAAPYLWMEVGRTVAGDVAIVGNSDGGYDILITGDNNLDDRNWHLITFTKSNGIGTFYIDGFAVSASGTLDNGNVNKYTTTLGINGDLADATRVNGNLDEFRGWSRALNATEVLELHANSLGRNMVLGTEKSVAAGTIAVTSPNSTHFAGSIPYNFTMTNLIWAQSLCWISPRNNGTWTSVGNATNNTAKTGTFTENTPGSYTFNVTCESLSGNTTNSTTYTVTANTLVDVMSPTGTSYLSNTSYSFYLNSTVWSSSSCWISPRNNGTWDYIGNATNGTLKTGSFIGQGGGWTFNLTCQSPSGNITDSSTYSLIDFEFISNTTITQDYESNTSLFYLTVNTSERIANITAAITWNGTATTANTSIVGSEYRFNASLTVPLITANTSIVQYFNYTVNWLNGTTATYGTTPNTIALNQSYIIAQINNTPATVTEGDEITFQMRITKDPTNYATISAVYFTVNNNVAAATLLSSTATYSIYRLTTYAPAGSGTGYYNSTVSLTFGGVTLNKTSSTANYTAYEITATNCSAGSESTTEFIRFTFFDEENVTRQVNSSLELMFTIAKNTITKQFNFTFDGNYSYPICFYPANATITVNATMKYDANSYSNRYYYLWNAALTNTSTGVNLYLLNDSLTTEFSIYVVDNNQQIVSNAIVNVQRYYIGENLFRAVAMGLTDQPAGVTKINLRQAENLYKMSIVVDGETVTEFYPVSLVSTSVTLPLSSTDYTKTYARSALISSACVNTSDVLYCTFTDSSGLNPTVRLRVIRLLSFTNATACDSSVTSSSGTIICPLGNYTNTNFLYSFVAEYSDGVRLILNSGVLSYTGDPEFKGEDGLVLTLLIVLVGALGFLTSPVAGVVGAYMGLWFAILFQLVDISYTAMGALGLVVVVMVWRLRY